MSSVPLALLLGRLLPGAQGCVSDLTSACVILSPRAPTEPTIVPLPVQRTLAPRRNSLNKGIRLKSRQKRLRHPLHDLSARSRRTRRTKTERDSVESTWLRSPQAKKFESA